MKKIKKAKKTKRERRRNRILQGKLFKVRIDGFAKDELLTMKRYAKSLGLSGVSELIKHALTESIKRKDGSVAWAIPEELREENSERTEG